MNRIFNFAKTSAIGGLLVIVPVAIVLFVLAQLLFVLYSLANSVMVELGLEINDALIILGVAVSALIGLCFLTGMIVKTRFGDAMRKWLNNNIGKRIPMYSALASLTKRFAGQDGSQFDPVEADLYGTGAMVIGFLIEHLPDERCTVFIPSAPIATVGTVYVVPLANIHKLDASVAETITVVSQWGVDSSVLYRPPESSTKTST